MADIKQQDDSYPEVYRNLMAVGLLGACYRVGEDADKVNNAVEATLADTSEFRMYRALAQGIGGDATLAAAEIGRRIERDPDDDRSKVALAVSLMLAGDPEWKNLIENVLAVSTDQVAREAATNLVQYLKALRIQ
jgi:hypothetical protein